MKYLFAFILLLSPQLSFAGFYAETELLNTLQKQLQGLIDKAKTCVPDEDDLCTGVKFGPAQLKVLRNLNLSSCKQTIESKKFKLVSDIKKYPEFQNSTMRAQTLYDEKVVLYKPKAFSKIDCLHELLHIYQHNPTLDTDLSPAQRRYLENKYMEHLNKAVIYVEETEKSGNKAEAVKMSETIISHINFMKEWKALDQWLDEKDVHYFIYNQCDSFKCEDLDRDIALSNLFHLQKYFPQEEAARIKKDSIALIIQKEEKALKQMHEQWKATRFINTSELFKLSWTDLLNKLNSQKIKFYKVDLNLKNEDLPKEVFEKLPSAREDIIKNSKISSGQAFAKFYPPNMILLTPIATRTSVVHEYLHYQQIKTNPLYEEALSKSPNLMNLFQSGKISREEYEEKAMLYNAFMWMGEFEVYKTLLEHSESIPSLENLNNKELFLHYQKKVKISQ